MIRKWNTDNKDINRKCVDEVIARVSDIEDPEQIGVIAAQDIIDIVLENMGPEIYNKAIGDTMKIVNDKFQETEYGIEDLKQS